MRLPNLEGYLKFPGPFPVASIRLRYVARPAAAERFVPREGGWGGTPPTARTMIPNAATTADPAATGEFPDIAANATVEAAEADGATVDLPPLGR